MFVYVALYVYILLGTKYSMFISCKFLFSLTKVILFLSASPGPTLSTFVNNYVITSLILMESAFNSCSLFWTFAKRFLNRSRKAKQRFSLNTIV